MDHNSKEFHDDFGKISPDEEYRNQLSVAVMAVRDFGFPVNIAAGAYQVKPEDIMAGIRDNLQ